MIAPFILTEVSKAMAQVVRHNHREQILFEQQHSEEEIEDCGHVKSPDEEKFLSMVRMTVKDGSPGDEKIMFVFQNA